MWRRLLADQEGQTLIEYGLLTALLAIVAIAILMVVGRKTRDTFTSVESSMVTAAI
jgi:pilus assembly protein Flp/PilA